jgi:ribonuclease P protein component
VQRLKTRPQYEAAMAGGTISRTAHFVLHRASLDAKVANPASPVSSPTGPESKRPQALFAVREAWIGAVVPKRWAKRAVTRNGIKRQVYNVSAQFEPRLAVAAHVVRLRTGFARDQFESAWSDALKHAVRAELLQLFEQVARKGSAVAPPAGPVAPSAESAAPTADSAAPSAESAALPSVIPAQAGIQGAA